MTGGLKHSLLLEVQVVCFIFIMLIGTTVYEFVLIPQVCTILTQDLNEYLAKESTESVATRKTHVTAMGAWFPES